MKKLTVTSTLSIIFFFMSHITIALPLHDGQQSWYHQEIASKHDILHAFWEKRILPNNQKSIKDFKNTIIANHFPNDGIFEIKIEKLFRDAIDHKINFYAFFNTLQDQPFVLIESMNHAEQLIPEQKYVETIPHINTTDLNNLQEYITKKKLSATVTLGTKEGLITPEFKENKSKYTFAIHSVGKIFTGILALLMVQENIITEDELNQPIKLNEQVLQKLPLKVRAQLSKVTFHQLMTHQAGIGDYLPKYIVAIREGLIPSMRHTEDFLSFVDDEVYPIGEYRYSNTGILLVGLAMQHAYEKKFKDKIDYNDILKKFIIDEVGMPSFSPWRPANGLYNPYDSISLHIVGSPAGGYWVTSHDLAKFGKWIYNKTRTDANFKKLLKKYGQEFYHPDQQLIVHAGGLPSSMAFFLVSLKTGGILAYASNQPPSEASDLKEMIQRHIFMRESIREAQLKLTLNSTAIRYG